VVVWLLKDFEKKKWAKKFKLEVLFWAIPKTLSKFWKIQVEKLKNIFYQKYNKFSIFVEEN
jgi:hypothetical protein